MAVSFRVGHSSSDELAKLHVQARVVRRMTEQNHNLVCPVCGASLTIRDEVALPGALGILSGKRAFHGLAVF